MIGARSRRRVPGRGLRAGAVLVTLAFLAGRSELAEAQSGVRGACSVLAERSPAPSVPALSVAADLQLESRLRATLGAMRVLLAQPFQSEPYRIAMDSADESIRSLSTRLESDSTASAVAATTLGAMLRTRSSPITLEDARLAADLYHRLRLPPEPARRVLRDRASSAFDRHQAWNALISHAGDPWLQQDGLLALCDLAAVADGRLRFWAVPDRPADVSPEAVLDSSEVDLARYVAWVLFLNDRLPERQLVRDFEGLVGANNPVARLLSGYWERSGPGH